jgi:hypothetical protein
VPKQKLSATRTSSTGFVCFACSAKQAKLRRALTLVQLLALSLASEVTFVCFAQA